MQKKLSSEIRFSVLGEYDKRYLVESISKDLDEYKQVNEILEQMREIVVNYVKQYIVPKDTMQLFRKSLRIAERFKYSFPITLSNSRNLINESYIYITIGESDNIPALWSIRDSLRGNLVEVIEKDDASSARMLKKLIADYIMAKKQLNDKIKSITPQNLEEYTYQDLLNYNKDWFERLMEIKSLTNAYVYGETPEDEPGSIEERLKILKKKLEE